MLLNRTHKIAAVYEQICPRPRILPPFFHTQFPLSAWAIPFSLFLFLWCSSPNYLYSINTGLCHRPLDIRRDGDDEIPVAKLRNRKLSAAGGDKELKEKKEPPATKDPLHFEQAVRMIPWQVNNQSIANNREQSRPERVVSNSFTTAIFMTLQVDDMTTMLTCLLEDWNVSRTIFRMKAAKVVKKPPSLADILEFANKGTKAR